MKKNTEYKQLYKEEFKKIQDINKEVKRIKIDKNLAILKAEKELKSKRSTFITEKEAMNTLNSTSCKKYYYIDLSNKYLKSITRNIKTKECNIPSDITGAGEAISLTECDNKIKEIRETCDKLIKDTSRRKEALGLINKLVKDNEVSSNLIHIYKEKEHTYLSVAIPDESLKSTPDDIELLDKSYFDGFLFEKFSNVIHSYNLYNRDYAKQSYPDKLEYKSYSSENLEVFMYEILKKAGLHNKYDIKIKEFGSDDEFKYLKECSNQVCPVTEKASSIAKYLPFVKSYFDANAGPDNKLDEYNEFLKNFIKICISEDGNLNVTCVNYMKFIIVKAELTKKSLFKRLFRK